MSKQLLTLHSLLLIIVICIANDKAFSALAEKTEKKPVVITSQTLTADNKNSTAVFEGAVVARTDDITIYSDKMTVYYDNAKSKIDKIEASGNVKVLKKERAIFSEKAVYMDNEQKIIFNGNPKAVEGENVITGTQIIFFLRDDRAVVEGSRVILQNTKRTN